MYTVPNLLNTTDSFVQDQNDIQAFMGYVRGIAQSLIQQYESGYSLTDMSSENYFAIKKFLNETNSYYDFINKYYDKFISAFDLFKKQTSSLYLTSNQMAYGGEKLMGHIIAILYTLKV